MPMNVDDHAEFLPGRVRYRLSGKDTRETLVETSLALGEARSMGRARNAAGSRDHPEIQKVVVVQPIHTHPSI